MNAAGAGLPPLPGLACVDPLSASDRPRTLEMLRKQG
jgi:hypothetical protein